MSEQDQYLCSFCGKPQSRAKRLIAGPAGVFICASCVEVCQNIFTQQGYLVPPPEPLQVCSFCGKPYDQWQNGYFPGKNDVKICFWCVHWYANERARVLSEVLTAEPEPSDKEQATT